MSDEETRPDASEATSGEAPGSTETSAAAASEEKPVEAAASAAQPSEAAAGGAGETGGADDASSSGDAGGASAASEDRGSHAVVKDAPVEHAALAATVLGDTLPSAVRTAIADAGGHGHASGDAHGGHGDEHFAHTLPMKVLVGVLGALIVLTVLTVAVTSLDLGSQGNFVVAMIIATIKAALVMGYFMHLVWDSKFNVFVFLSSFLFVMLFLSMALLDRQEYQTDIDTFEADQKATAQ